MSPVGHIEVLEGCCRGSPGVTTIHYDGHDLSFVYILKNFSKNFSTVR